MKTANTAGLANRGKTISSTDRDKARKVSKQLDEEIAAKKKDAGKREDCSAKAAKAETDSIVATAKLSELNSEIVEKQKAVDKLPDVLALVVEAGKELEAKKKDIQAQDDLKGDIEVDKITLEKAKAKVRSLDITISEKEKEIEELPAKFAEEEAKLEEIAKSKAKERDEIFEQAKGEQSIALAAIQDEKAKEKGEVKKWFTEQKKREAECVNLETENEKKKKKLEETDEEIKKKYAQKEKSFAEKVAVLNGREEQLDFGQKMVNEAIQRTTVLKQALEKIHGKSIQIQLPQKINFKCA